MHKDIPSHLEYVVIIFLSVTRSQSCEAPQGYHRSLPSTQTYRKLLVFISSDTFPDVSSKKLWMIPCFVKIIQTSHRICAALSSELTDQPLVD